MSEGMYLVKVETAEGSMIQKINIVK